MTKHAPLPLVLVDGSSYLFRAYYALPPLTNDQGEPTGAMYGVLNMLKKLQDQFNKHTIVVVFDPPGKTFRHEMFDAYKANRAKMPEDLAAQIAPLHTMIQALGFPLVLKEGMEADDVIGTLTTQACQQGIPVIISTGDKDMAQLVSDQVTLINTMTQTTLDMDGVMAKFGVPPEKIIDYLALIGDTVDNIPGVAKVGPKTAVKWLDQYGSLDQLIANKEAIGGKVGENLRAAVEDLPLYRQLVTIQCDVALDRPLSALVMQPEDTAVLHDSFSRYGFKNWLKALDVVPQAAPMVHENYQTIFTEEALAALITDLVTLDAFALDTETTSLDARAAQLVGISIAFDQQAFYIPVAHDYPGAPAQLQPHWVCDQLKPILQDDSKCLIGQNLKYDLTVLRAYGIERRAHLFDTMVASYVLYGSSTRHDLDSMAARHLNRTMVSFESLAGKGAQQKTFNQIDCEQAAHYAAEDAAVTFALYGVFKAALSEVPALESVFNTMDMPLVAVLTQMEANGVAIDVALLKQQSAELEQKIASLQGRAYELAGEVFNLQSPKQLQAVLFDQMGLPVLKKTPSGQPSTAESVLQDLAREYELPRVIMEHRSLSKLKSTYTDKLPQQVNAKTQRVHTTYNQTVTATGRLSSNHPNLQNIPVRTKEGRKIRRAFIPAEGCQFIAADYSQIELRIIASLAQDPGLLKAFHAEQDVHRATAAEVFGVRIEAVTQEQRRQAKAINFGLLYGMGAYGLSQNLQIDRATAQQYIDQYFERYPLVRAYMDKTASDAAACGYVETLFGRRIPVSDINATNYIKRNAAVRAAINAPMQGTAADIIKRAMLCVDQWLSEEERPIRMILQVHDELIIECPRSAVADASERLVACMENAASLSVPLVVDVGVGNHWDDAH